MVVSDVKDNITAVSYISKKSTHTLRCCETGPFRKKYQFWFHLVRSGWLHFFKNKGAFFFNFRTSTSRGVHTNTAYKEFPSHGRGGEGCWLSNRNVQHQTGKTAKKYYEKDHCNGNHQVLVSFKHSSIIGGTIKCYEWQMKAFIQRQNVSGVLAWVFFILSWCHLWRRWKTSYKFQNCLPCVKMGRAKTATTSF